MYKKVGSIYSTENYDMFQKLNGNRAVLDARKALIVSSIKDRGYIRNPIVVNEKMEIIDGQGRFEALKELGMPIEYVFARGATIADCIALNIKQKNWNLRDYVKCYADIGNPDYVLFASLFGKYENIGDSALPAIGTVIEISALFLVFSVNPLASFPIIKRSPSQKSTLATERACLSTTQAILLNPQCFAVSIRLSEK